MTAAQATQVLSSVVQLAASVPDVIAKLNAWMHGDGAKPDDVLAQLPDLARVHLELAALELRAKAAGG